MLMTAEEAMARSGSRAHAGEDSEFASTDHSHRQGDNHDDFDADSVFSKLKSKNTNDSDN